MRRRAAPKRAILPDPKYRSKLLARFINQLMKRGKKSIAEQVTYDALEIVSSKMKDKLKKELSQTSGDIVADGESDSPILTLFAETLDKVSPTVEVRSRRVGGSTYQVPVEVRPARRQTLGMRWLIKAAKQRNEKSMAERLANEIMDILAGRGIAMKMAEDMRRMAKANQAFAGYRW